jgi:hypothetical protein
MVWNMYSIPVGTSIKNSNVSQGIKNTHEKYFFYFQELKELILK